jgi:NhaP-type Na+/H+ or K+/H+ antiporter
MIAAVIVTRFIWILPATYLPRALSPALGRRDPYPPFGVPESWAGMRGAVSLAAALALPEAFPGRDFILTTTFAVILVTVLIQGATLAPLIRVLGLSGFTQDRPKTLSEAEARAQMAAAQLTEVEQRSAGAGDARRHPRLLEQ